MKLLIQYRQLSRVEKVTVGFSYLLRLSLAAAVGVFIYEQNWLHAFLTLGILILTVVPTILRQNYLITLPVELELVLFFYIYAALFLGEIQAFYTQFWWWDKVLHTNSGLFLGLGGFLLVYILNEQRPKSVHLKPGFVALFAFTFAVALGGLWEIFEFGMDSFFGLNMQKSGLIDTMWDLIVDSLGALTIAILGYVYCRKKRVFFQRFLEKIIKKQK